MLFVIKHSNGTYFHNKGRIILYESPEQATRFLKEFIEYAMNRLVQEGADHMEIMTVPMTVQMNSQIMNVDFDIDEVECGTVYATDL
jgi:hypothetical protein